MTLLYCMYFMNFIYVGNTFVIVTGSCLVCVNKEVNETTIQRPSPSLTTGVRKRGSPSNNFERKRPCGTDV